MKRIVLALAFVVSAAQAGADHQHPKKDYGALEPLKQMAGTWQMFDQDGKAQGDAVFAVTSGGSAVREVLFPGSAHEMTNMYHLDGGQILLTHYCAGGNQPRMRSAPGKETLDFKFDSVTNVMDKHESYMGAMKLTLKDADTATQEWTTFEGDKQTRHTFRMKRKKA